MLYISPLKALAVDRGAQPARATRVDFEHGGGEGHGLSYPAAIAVRTGDTPPARAREVPERAAGVRHILITTPESLSCWSESNAHESL